MTALPEVRPWHSADRRLEVRKYGEELSTLQIISAASFAGKIVPRRHWHVEGLIPGRTVTLLSADGGIGKSTLAMQLSASTALGMSWLGCEVAQGGVLYLSAEDEVDEMHRRLETILSFEPHGFEDLSNFEIAPLAGLDAILAAPEGRVGSLKRTPLFAEIEAHVLRTRPSLIVVDTLADTFGGDEIVKVQARSFIGMLRKLAMDADAAVVLIAHPSLSGMQSGSGTSGNVAWSNSVRSRIYMTRPDGEPDLRDIEVMKSNYGPSGTKMTVRYQDGRFVATDQTPAKNRPALDEEARLTFLDMLAQFTREGRTVSHQPGPTWAPKVFSAHARGGGIGRPIFARAMDRLLSDGRVKIETFGPPSKRRSMLVEAPVSSPKGDAE